MKICPTCNSQVAVLIVNLQTGQRFCHHCAGQECPTFLPHFVLTVDDVQFLRDCGIEPGVSRIAKVLRESTGDNDETE